MKKHLAILMSLIVAAGATTASAEVKIGTVNMNKIFSSYYKTKDAEAKINEARTTAKTELDDRMASYKKNLEDINKLNQEMQKDELSAKAKEQKAKSRDEKIAEAKGLEREINEFRQTREKQLQDQAVRMRNGIVEEISGVVQKIVEAKGFDIVLDNSGNSLNGVPILVHATDKIDFSEEVIKELNAKKPAK